METTYPSLIQELKDIRRSEVMNLAHVVCHLKCMDMDSTQDGVTAYLTAYKEFLWSIGVHPKVVARIVLLGTIRGLKEYQMLINANSRIVEVLQQSASHHAHAGSSIVPSISPNIKSNAEDLAYICQDLFLVTN